MSPEGEPSARLYPENNTRCAHIIYSYGHTCRVQDISRAIKQAAWRLETTLVETRSPSDVLQRHDRDIISNASHSV